MIPGKFGTGRVTDRHDGHCGRAVPRSDGVPVLKSSIMGDRRDGVPAITATLGVRSRVTRN
eukprot:265232-Hanusia_phi.AAC.1